MKHFLKNVSVFIFKFASRLGVFFLPVHYYVPLADIPGLKRTKQLWAKKSELPGVDSDLDKQVNSLYQICKPYQEEYAGNHNFRYATEHHFGPGYGYIEAQALHGVIRHYKPRRIIEVGSGVSSYCMLKALEKNKEEFGSDFKMTLIEPYASDELQALDQAELIQKPVQNVPFEVFGELTAGDLLFIDSSHTIKPGSDVNYLILEVLPRLRPGVIIHFHDIFLPYDYPRNVLNSYFQWMETSLLRAYLVHNQRAQIIFCLSQLHYDRQGDLRKVFPEYNPAPDENGLEVTGEKNNDDTHYPASIYIKII
jgi:predicted O-methyltransferase YrrM